RTSLATNWTTSRYDDDGSVRTEHTAPAASHVSNVDHTPREIEYLAMFAGALCRTCARSTNARGVIGIVPAQILPGRSQCMQDSQLHCELAKSCKVPDRHDATVAALTRCRRGRPS